MSAMHRRKWNAKTKTHMVLEGLQGKPVAEICNEYGLDQSQYDQCRDQFLAQAAHAFEPHQHTRTEACLEQKNARLKQLVGELTFELQKPDELWGWRGAGRFG
jgi:transposase-like protein